MKLFHSDTRGNEKNTLYPHEIKVTDIRSFEKLASYDHVMAKYKNNKRSNDNFLESDCIAMDIDNSGTDDTSKWVGIRDIKKDFDGIKFGICYSRNHMKEKGTESARPRFHIYFPIPKVYDLETYVSYKEKLALFFPYFDQNALDGARFFYGVDGPVVEIIRGRNYVTSLLHDDFEDLDKIKQGSRNTTMSRFAGSILVRLGESEKAKKLFYEKAEQCVPPLDDDELNQIWRSALGFYSKIKKSPSYIPPEDYEKSLRPDPFSDLGQASVLVGEYEDILKYSKATNFMVYTGKLWEESDLKAQLLSQELVKKQMEEAQASIQKIKDKVIKLGIYEKMAGLSKAKAMALLSSDEKRLLNLLEEEEKYLAYAIKRGDSRAINATLKEAMPMVEVDPSIFDRDEFLLNCHHGVVNLKTGESLDHEPSLYLSKMTNTKPSNKGKDIWLDALDTFFLKDKDLIDYVQKIVGLAAIGKVYLEALIIAYGDGKNGKSTFWNVIARVLGSYSGTISSDILSANNTRNIKPEIAETKGKRLLIAAELEEGMRLSTSIIKQLCSTDEVNAEKKFKAPFKFTPTHTLVLYTNHLPKVGAIDDGTWRRLIVIPFLAKIKAKDDIKNYGDYLYKESSEYILQWIIDGAKKAIALDFKFKRPRKVEDAINKYKEDNDWLGKFIEDCCELDEDFVQKSGVFYQEYRAYCMRTGEHIRSTTDFYNALDIEGFIRRKTNKGSFIHGVRLKDDEFSVV
ncbi:phage/plasmid primase, P4 family [Allofustis seminis]|uniref:phage/plasmid primase, P4 family n=1 Tax=Allofustis seminis TaxID=166939 RepID=UPI0003621504|nr:phage/plasmid primase, P4 family [Allofustis seminis]